MGYMKHRLAVILRPRSSRLAWSPRTLTDRGVGERTRRRVIAQKRG